MLGFFKVFFKKFGKFHPVVQVVLVFGLLFLLRMFYNKFLYSYFSAFNLEGFGTPKELVYFYWKDCGHCKRFSPVWDEFTKKYNGSIKLRKVEKDDIGAKDELEKYKIRGFPTIMLLDGNGGHKDFDGERNVDSLMSFLN